MSQDNNIIVLNQEADEEEISVNIAELIHVLCSKIHIIVLSAILTALVAFLATKLFMTPVYTSVTKLYVMTKNGENSSSATYTELQSGSMLTKDYMEMVKSRPVLEKVISELNLDMEPEDLEEMITTETPTETRIMSIYVQSTSPKQAKQIADAVRNAVNVQIKQIMNVDSVNTVEEANLPMYPSSPSTKKNMLIGGLLGILASVGIVLFVYLSDDTLKTPADIERYLGLNVLTSIPIQTEEKKVKKRKKR